MNGSKILVDTNILLYFLQGDNRILSVFEENEIYISFISELEILGFPELDKKEEVLIRNFLKNFTIININKEIKNTVIQLRKRYKLKLPDCIIAATAIYKKMPLLSADNDFRKVEEIDFILYEI